MAVLRWWNTDTEAWELVTLPAIGMASDDYVQIAGDTMTGPLRISYQSSTSHSLETPGSASIGGNLNVTGFLGVEGGLFSDEQASITFNGPVALNTAPTDPDHAANKEYVDQAMTDAQDYADQAMTDVKNYVDQMITPIIVIGPDDAVPDGTVQGTIIIRKEQ